MPTVHEFFVSEASEYLDRIRSALTGLESGEVEAQELHRHARGLRGSAQMARQDNVLRLAAALEAAARGLAAGSLRWNDELRATAQRTERAVRRILEGEERDPERLMRDVVEDWRGLGVSADLVVAAAPVDPRARTREFRTYAAREAGGILNELTVALTDLSRDPSDREPLKALLRRQRALLGSAQLESLPVVAETLKALDDVTRLVARANVPVLGDWAEFYRIGRDVLAAAISPLQRGDNPTHTPGVAALRQLCDQIMQRHGGASSAGVPAAPPQQSADVMAMFRKESADLLGRIERMAGELAAAPAHRQAEVRRELRAAMSAVRDTARTFGFPEAAAAAEVGIQRSAIGGAVEMLAVVADLREIIAGEGDGGETGSARAPAPARQARREPARRPVVPVESLLYRGDAALRRALELQPAIERTLAGEERALEALAEVFDLIRLGIE